MSSQFGVESDQKKTTPGVSSSTFAQPWPSHAVAFQGGNPTSKPHNHQRWSGMKQPIYMLWWNAQWYFN